MSYTFKEACETLTRIYVRSGYKGIGVAGDTGKEWAFTPAPADGEEVPFGENPLFFDKESGRIRRMVFDLPDMNLILSAKKMELPIV